MHLTPSAVFENKFNDRSYRFIDSCLLLTQQSHNYESDTTKSYHSNGAKKAILHASPKIERRLYNSYFMLSIHYEGKYVHLIGILLFHGYTEYRFVVDIRRYDVLSSANTLWIFFLFLSLFISFSHSPMKTHNIPRFIYRINVDCKQKNTTPINSILWHINAYTCGHARAKYVWLYYNPTPKFAVCVNVDDVIDGID